MPLAIDFDDTLSAHSYLVDLVKANSGKHYLITHRQETSYHNYQLENDMEAVGLSWHNFKGIIMCPTIIRDNINVAKIWKAEQCKNLGIKYLIDDNFAVSELGCTKYDITLLHPHDDKNLIEELDWN